MATTYRAIVLTGKGGLERLEERALPLTLPKAGEIRIRVRAAGAGATDVTMRTGQYPYRPAFPFVVGYEVVGDIDALGEGVVGFTLGERVCALTVFGAQAEFLVRAADEFVKVPAGLDDAEVIALILNYVTAYQMIHRCTELTSGQRALVTGASGGVGTALLELLRLIGVKAVGAASPARFDIVRSLGGDPVDSRAKPLEESVHAVCPEGVDVAFDGLGGKGTAACIRSTRRGGLVVGYGFVDTIKKGRSSTFQTVRGFWSLFIGAFFAGRKSVFYGITQRYRRDRTSFKEDLATLFVLLGERKIAPKVAARLPLLAGVEAQRLLESGGVVGKIVLLASA